MHDRRLSSSISSSSVRSSTITRLGFKKSMDALLLENELETLTHD